MRTGIIGLGAMGRRHLLALLEMGLAPVALNDTRVQTLDLIDRSLRDAWAGDLQTVLERKPDLLIIATTAPSHAPLVEAAAEAGVPYILCEKPMATSLAECDRMTKATTKNGVKLAINHQMRFMNVYQEVAALIQRESFGGWTSVTVSGGNMGIAMNGVHYFELLRWLTGEPIQQVSAWLSAVPIPNPRGEGFQDHAGEVRLTTASGKRMFLAIHENQGHGIRAMYAGRNGLLVADELGGTLDLSERLAEDRDKPTSRYGCPSIDTRHTFVVDDTVRPTRRLIEALIGGGDYPTATDGRHAMATLIAAHVSSAEGNRAVDVDERLPLTRKLPIA